LIVITATEIVHTEIGIIIVSTVTEGIVGVGYEPIGGGSTAYQRNSSFTPSIVVIGGNLGSALVIDRNDIALKILLKQIIIEYSGSKGTCAVSNTYRSLTFIVQINEGVGFNAVNINRFLYDLRTIKGIFVTSNLTGIIIGDLFKDSATSNRRLCSCIRRHNKKQADDLPK